MRISTAFFTLPGSPKILPAGRNDDGTIFISGSPSKGPIRMSFGASRSTGPIFPDVAAVNALPTYSGSRFESMHFLAHLV